MSGNLKRSLFCCVTISCLCLLYGTESVRAQLDSTLDVNWLPFYFGYSPNPPFSVTSINDTVYISGSMPYTPALEGKYLYRAVRNESDSESRYYSVGNDFNGSIFESVSTQDYLYVAGSFTRNGEDTMNHIAQWDGTRWNSLRGGTLELVKALFAQDSLLYIGGKFTSIDGITINNIALWDGTNWHPLGAGVKGTVNAIAAIGTDVYVGGVFDTAGTTPARNIARWDGSDWYPLNYGVNGEIFALHTVDSELYVGGNFTIVDTFLTASSIARWNGYQWTSLGIDSLQGVNGSVRSIQSIGANVFIGGLFSQAGNVRTNNIVKFSNGSWQGLGNGLDGMVHDMTVFNEHLVVVGSFHHLGTKYGQYIGVWNDSTSMQNVINKEYHGDIILTAVDSANIHLTIDKISISSSSIYIYDIMGRLIKEIPNLAPTDESESIKIDITTLPSGFYFCKIRNKTDEHIRKIIITR